MLSMQAYKPLEQCHDLRMYLASALPAIGEGSLLATWEEHQQQEGNHQEPD